jgi:hypothetical protein
MDDNSIGGQLTGGQQVRSNPAVLGLAALVFQKLKTQGALNPSENVPQAPAPAAAQDAGSGTGGTGGTNTRI